MGSNKITFKTKDLKTYVNNIRQGWKRGSCKLQRPTFGEP